MSFMIDFMVLLPAANADLILTLNVIGYTKVMVLISILASQQVAAIHDIHEATCMTGITVDAEYQCCDLSMCTCMYLCACVHIVK